LSIAHSYPLLKYSLTSAKKLGMRGFHTDDSVMG